MTNPLLELEGLPPFSRIKPAHVEPAIDQLLRISREKTETLLKSAAPFTWASIIAPLERLDDRLGRAWSPVNHMNSVVNSDELRQAYNACLPKLSEYATEMGQNERLFNAYKAVAEGNEKLDTAQRKLLKNALRDFHLSGVDLAQEKKVRFKEISQQLSKLGSQFEENLLDATNAWSKLITDAQELAGLPESALGLARQTAEARGEQQGWMLTLEFPSYLPVMTYADNRELRRELYWAFSTRASDQGPHAGQWDNSETIEHILRLRHEQAQLLGFDNYAERSLAKKMAESSEQVMNFLEDLTSRSHLQARAELDELRSFAAEQYQAYQIEA